MSFVRDDAAARLRAWAEPAVMGGAVALGLWLLWRGFMAGGWLLALVGALLAVIGALLLVTAIRRLRLRAKQPEAGVLVTDEGRVTYLGPHGGGSVAIPALVLVEIVDREWALHDADGTVLRIPLGAVGAERLPDALAQLPGLDLHSAIAALGSAASGSAIVWPSRPDRPARTRLGRH